MHHAAVLVEGEPCPHLLDPVGPAGDVQGVRAPRRVRLGSDLDQLGAPHEVGLVGAVHVETDRVEPRRAQPGVGPVGQRGAVRPLHRREEVAHLGVAVRVPLQVVPHAGHERLVADVGDQLPQHRGPLGVGDAVKVLQGGEGVLGAVARHRVRRRRALGGVAPGLADDPLVGPGVGVEPALDDAPAGHVLRERLVEPQVVPPGQRHQVAEPHVRHLVADGVVPRQQLGAGHAGAEEVLVAQDHAAGVLHRAGVELRHPHLVVLAEGITDPEQLVEVVEAAAGHLQDPRCVGLELGPDRTAGVEAQRDPVVLLGDAHVGAGADRHEVGRDRRRLGQVPHVALAGRGAVADHHPVARRGHGERAGCLEVRLVEAGEHPRRRVHERVAVDVVLAVGRVDRPVQAGAVLAVAHRRADDELVVGRQTGQPQPTVGQGVGRHRLTVERRLLQLGRLEVDEGALARGGGEGEDGAAAEGRLALGEVELDGIAGVLHGRGAPSRLRAGQAGHGPTVSHPGSCRWVGDRQQCRMPRAGGIRRCVTRPERARSDGRGQRPW